MAEGNFSTLPAGVTLLRAGTGNRTVVFVSPTGGAHGFDAVVAELPPEYTVLGMDNESVPIDTLVNESVEEQARRFLEWLREAQPAGPCYLAGFSFGAHVAYEMAMRLAADGAEVACLVILDTWPAGPPESPAAARLKRLGEVAAKAPSRMLMAFRARREVAAGFVRLANVLLGRGKGEYANMSARECVEAIHLAVLSHARHAPKPQSEPESGTRPPGKEIETIRLRAARKVAADKRAIGAYRMTPIPVRIALFGTTFERSRNTLNQLESLWRPLAGGGLSVRWFDCGHVALIRAPMAAETGRALCQELEALP